MNIAVLVERTENNGYRARGAEPFGLSAEGESRDEALSNLQDQIETRLKNGAEVVTLTFNALANPWLAMAGMLKDEPMISEWRQAMTEYRHEMDSDPDCQ